MDQVAPRRVTKRLLAAGLLLSMVCFGFGRTPLPGGPVPPTLPIGDRKALHGAHCKPVDKDGTGVDASYQEFGVRDNSGPPVTYICPLVRDVIGGTSDLNHAIVEMEIFDLSSCTLFSMSEDGASGLILDSVSVSATDQDHRFIQFEFFGLETSGGNEGAYWLECTLRFRDTINHIYTNEGT